MKWTTSNRSSGRTVRNRRMTAAPFASARRVVPSDHGCQRSGTRAPARRSSPLIGSRTCTASMSGREAHTASKVRALVANPSSEPLKNKARTGPPGLRRVGGRVSGPVGMGVSVLQSRRFIRACIPGIRPAAFCSSEGKHPALARRANSPLAGTRSRWVRTCGGRSPGTSGRSPPGPPAVPPLCTADALPGQYIAPAGSTARSP